MRKTISMNKYAFIGICALITTGAVLVTAGINPSPEHKEDIDKYEINIEPSKEAMVIAIELSQEMTDDELRTELSRLAPRIYKTEQLISFVHALQLYMQDNEIEDYKLWEKTWFDSSTILFGFANFTGHDVRDALNAKSSRIDLQTAFVSAKTMLPLLEEASSKVSSGILVDVMGYSQDGLLLEPWVDIQ
ncbi:MAG: hypothetical protein P1U42_11510 [Phycisphaerales bacterium]|nr:hypothetical protein [Phycisphaerales bacterium]